MIVFSMHVFFLTHIKITGHIPYCDLETNHHSKTKKNCYLKDGVSFFEYFFRYSSNPNTVSENVVWISLLCNIFFPEIDLSKI